MELLKGLILDLEKNKNDNSITEKLLKPIQHNTFLHTTEFIEWLSEQVDLGNSYAQDYSGDMLFKQEYYKDAVRLYELSANQGNTHAQMNLANMYIEGYGVSRDISVAFELLVKSCGGGCSEGKNLLLYTLIYQDIKEGQIADTLCDISITNNKLMKEVIELKEINKKLEADNEILKTEVDYRPGGEGYERAKEDAESLFGILLP